MSRGTEDVRANRGIEPSQLAGERGSDRSAGPFPTALKCADCQKDTLTRLAGECAQLHSIHTLTQFHCDPQHDHATSSPALATRNSGPSSSRCARRAGTEAEAEAASGLTHGAGSRSKRELARCHTIRGQRALAHIPIGRTSRAEWSQKETREELPSLFIAHTPEHCCY